MTPEQVLEGATKIQRPNESLSEACVRSALFLRIHELTPKWTLPDLDFDDPATWGEPSETKQQ